LPDDEFQRRLELLELGEAEIRSAINNQKLPLYDRLGLAGSTVPEFYEEVDEPEESLDEGFTKRYITSILILPAQIRSVQLRARRPRNINQMNFQKEKWTTYVRPEQLYGAITRSSPAHLFLR
jgi:hypothetical protein